MATRYGFQGHGLEMCHACGITYVRRDGHSCLTLVLKQCKVTELLNIHKHLADNGKLSGGFNETIFVK